MVTNQWQPQTNFWGNFWYPSAAWWLPCTRWLTGNWLPISVQFAPPVHNHGKWIFFCRDFIKGASFHSPWIHILQNTLSQFSATLCERASSVQRQHYLSLLKWHRKFLEAVWCFIDKEKFFCNPTATTVKSQNATNHIVLGNNIILWSTAFMRQIC